MFIYSSEIMFSCNVCQKVYSTNFNLLKHIRRAHNQNMYLKKSNIHCSFCNSMFKHFKELRMHLVSYHDTPMVTNNYNFNNFSDFNEWKRKEEIQNCCRYVMVRGATHIGNDRIKREFICHRSGHEKRTRLIKTHISYKLNTTCPASIEAIINSDKTVDVTFYSTHISHNNKVEHLIMGREERAIIGTKLAKGYTFNEVLEEVKKTIKSDNLSPRYYKIKKKDLYNIRAYFECQKNHELDRTFKTVIQENQSNIVVTFTERDIQKHHKLGLRFNTKDIAEVSSTLWKVKMYAVEMVRPVMCNCYIKCSHCKICSHMFKCSCYTSITEQNTICSHIHAVVNYIGNGGNMFHERFFKNKNDCAETRNSISYIKINDITNNEKLEIDNGSENVFWDNLNYVDEEIFHMSDDTLGSVLEFTDLEILS